MKQYTDYRNIAYISTGSNMGDKLENCRNGLAALGQTDGIRIESISAFYLTEPMEYADQPWFVNAAVRIRTTLEPLDLLAALKNLEQRSGRVDSGIRFGPRTLDFDIIFYNDMVLDTPMLIVPHPRMHEREFVLRPICDLAPDLMHPVLKKTACQLLGILQPGGQQCIRMEETI
ncbi:MAG: 2-amino-4-hydroxy-6-hydroxymethyldihydropteridine diphosphokinase [Desulfosalsimonadaceae bacterium]|nr:2-amino-4-hydroxy-6-hydroxymethyldihydropteridine diphosphokinase [Desulfosalsimonadaceae bacterium]